MVSEKEKQKSMQEEAKGNREEYVRERRFRELCKDKENCQKKKEIEQVRNAKTDKSILDYVKESRKRKFIQKNQSKLKHVEHILNGKENRTPRDKKITMIAEEDTEEQNDVEIETQIIAQNTENGEGNNRRRKHGHFVVRYQETINNCN